MGRACLVAPTGSSCFLLLLQVCWELAQVRAQAYFWWWLCGSGGRGSPGLGPTGDLGASGKTGSF